MKYFSIIIFIFLFTFLILAQETLPPYHWVNNYIDYLKVRGYLPELSLIDRPFNRQQIAQQLIDMDWKTLENEPKDKEMVETLYREFAPEIQYLVGNLEEIENPVLKKALQKIMYAFIPESDQPHLKIGAFGTGIADYSDQTEDFDTDFNLHPHAGLYWRNHLTLYHNSKIFHRAEPNYIGKKFRNAYAYVEQAYLAYNWDWGEFKIGRDYLQIGPGRSGQLLISDNSRPFDMYRGVIGKKLFQFSFWGFSLDRRANTTAPLNQIGGTSNRYLNGHRLSLNFKNKVYVGLSEVIIYGGPNSDWEAGVMNPVMLYYAYIVNTPFFNGNVLYNIDWDLYLVSNLEIYGELLLDDIQVDKKQPGDLEPNEMGIMGGIVWTNPLPLIQGSIFQAEYVQVRNRTYNAPVNDWEKYLHRNEVIGYYLGNNFVRYGLAFSQWVRPDLRVKLFTNLIRQGEGSVQGEFNTDYLNYTVQEGYSEPFPWGVVERHLQPGLEVFFKPHRLAHLSLNIAYNDFKNYLNQSGEDYSELTASLTLWLQWDYLVNLGK